MADYVKSVQQVALKHGTRANCNEFRDCYTFTFFMYPNGRVLDWLDIYEDLQQINKNFSYSMSKQTFTTFELSKV